MCGGGLWSIEIDTIKEKKKFQFHELTDDLDIVIIITGIVKWLKGYQVLSTCIVCLVFVVYLKSNIHLLLSSNV